MSRAVGGPHHLAQTGQTGLPRPELAQVATIKSGELLIAERLSPNEDHDSLEVTTLYLLWPARCRLAFDGMNSPHQMNRRQIIRCSRFQIDLPKGGLGIGLGYVREGLAILQIRHDSPLKDIKLYDVVTALTIDGIRRTGLGAHVHARARLKSPMHIWTGTCTGKSELQGLLAEFRNQSRILHLHRPFNPRNKGTIEALLPNPTCVAAA